MECNSLSEQEAAALHAYVHALQERWGPQLLDVVLFGSKARGDAHPGSDIDVVVILDHPDAQALSDARALGFDIWLAYQELVSIRAMSRQSWQALAARQSLFYRNVVRDGISLVPVPA